MNKLSWALYLADVLPGVGVLLMILGAGITAAAVLWTLGTTQGPNDVGEVVPFQKAPEIKAKLLTMGVVVWTLGLLVPSQQTFYAVAASELGEQLIKTPTAAKAVRALDTWLDRKIQENISGMTEPEAPDASEEKTTR